MASTAPARKAMTGKAVTRAPRDTAHEGFLNHLASSVDRRDAALAIMNSEKVDMFHTLTLVDNQAVKRVPEKLSGLFQAILGSKFFTNK